MSLIIREMQIKTTMKYISYLSEWLSSINQQTTSAGEDVEKGGNLFALLVGIQTGKPLWKAVWRYLKKLKMDLPFDPAILVLRIYPNKQKH